MLLLPLLNRLPVPAQKTSRKTLFRLKIVNIFLNFLPTKSKKKIYFFKNNKRELKCKRNQKVLRLFVHCSVSFLTATAAKVKFNFQNLIKMNNVLITGCNRGLGLGLLKQILKLPNPPKHIFATCRDPQNAPVSFFRLFFTI